MTVAELIAKLQEMPGDREVVTADSGYGESDVSEVTLVDEQRKSRLTGEMQRINWVLLS